MSKTSQVAKPLTTLSEIMQSTPEALMLLSLQQLEEVHKIAQTGTTKAAKNKVDLVAGIISAKKKEEQKAAKAAKQPEAIANSVKAPAAPKAAAAAAAAPKGQAPAAPKGSTPAAPTAAPKAPGAKPQAATKPQAAAPAAPKAQAAAAAPKATPPIKPKKLEEMSPEELLAHAKTLEKKADKFPEEIETGKSVFKRVVPADAEELGAVLLAHPYNVFMFVDERIDDNLTQFLVTYASEKIIVIVDKNRQKECHMGIDTVTTLANNAIVEKQGGQTLTFPLAFYVKEKLQA